MKLIILLLFSLVLVQCGTKKETETKINREEVVVPDSTEYYDSVYTPLRLKIDKYFDNLIAQKRFNGSVLFAENGRIIHHKTHGFKDYKTKDSINNETAFQLASGSKPFTAIAVLKLIEEGKINFEDTIRKFIPEIPYYNITVEQLLSHRGGIGNYTYFTAHEWKDSSGILTNQGILDFWKDSIPDIYYPPGKAFDYSNTGYAMLAVLVERVSNMNFRDYMQFKVFEPNGMKNTFILDMNEEIGNVAKGHLHDYRKPGNEYLNGVVGDKGMYSNCLDMFHFDNALNNGKIISDSLLTRAMNRKNPIKKDGTSYGYGWRIYNADKPNQITYHTGWWQGFRSIYIKYPQENKTVIIMDNVKRGPFFSTKEILGLIVDDLNDPKQKESIAKPEDSTTIQEK